MFHNFPRHGKTISVILIIVIGYFIYLEWSRSPYNRTNDLKPGSKEYNFYHAEDWKDTVPEVTGHWWYKDSNNVWHEDNCGDTSCWIYRNGKYKNGRTDSSDYEKKIKS